MSGHLFFPGVFACPAHVVWARDTAGIIVVNENNGEARLLWGLECAVWSWLSLGYSYSELVELLAITLGTPGVEAQSQLDGMLSGWLSAGWLVSWPLAHDIEKELERG